MRTGAANEAVSQHARCCHAQTAPVPALAGQPAAVPTLHTTASPEKRHGIIPVLITS